MRPAVRYCITAGVAIGGVSILIAAPSSPPLRDVEVPSMQLSDNSHDNLDANSPSVLDLLQVMGGVESPVVVQNITESDSGVLEGGQPANVPGLSDLLNLQRPRRHPGPAGQVVHRHRAAGARQPGPRAASGQLVLHRASQHVLPRPLPCSLRQIGLGIDAPIWPDVAAGGWVVPGRSRRRR